MNNTSKLFSLTCMGDSCILWFLNKLNLTYQRLNDFVALFDFISIVLMSWDKFLLCHTPIKFLSAFQDQISILIVSCMTTWTWDLHHFLYFFEDTIRKWIFSLRLWELKSRSFEKWLKRQEEQEQPNGSKQFICPLSDYAS